MKELLDSLQLHAVCESAHCPNQGECFTRGVATLMILGNVCTRNCTFCAVEHGQPAPPDANEPGHVTEAVKKLGLRHVVVTSVTRDDLPDGGAYQFAKVIEAIHSYNSQISIEILIPDFQGSLSALEIVATSHPAIINHNIETVPRLYPQVRPQANYKRSLRLLKHAKLKEEELLTKSGLMLGLGERHEEIIQVMENLREANCDFLTIGQYLRPSPNHHEVVRFVSPVEFKDYKNAGVAMGFKGVASAPYVRSSFQADRMFKEISHSQGNVES
ncbi:lipoyl synthase [Chloroflexota bacterium]